MDRAAVQRALLEIPYIDDWFVLVHKYLVSALCDLDDHFEAQQELHLLRLSMYNGLYPWVARMVSKGPAPALCSLPLHRSCPCVPAWR